MSVIINKDSYIIENDFVSKTYTIASSKITSTSVTNKMTGEGVSFGQLSNEFVLRFNSLIGGENIKAGELKISSANSKTLAEKEALIIEFKPFKVRGCKISITLVEELLRFDSFIRKQLILKCENQNSEKAFLDYIDFAPYAVTEQSYSWCLPLQEKGIIGPVPLSLGQPVFYKNAFFGCEFPAALNKIENSMICSRRYYGKHISALADEAGYIYTDRAVCGVAPAASFESVRNAFFDYIEKIARPAYLRTQFNSWYDHMMEITRENIEQSFYEVEKGMSAVGSDALACFAVDDGWNDYSKDFWNFNSKFPDELYPSASQAKALGSSLGLWLGPRGGYSKDTVKFAKKIENGGNGFLNKKSADICVASDRYMGKLTEFMLSCQDRFDLSYWKLDGIAQKPCSNKKHDHSTGGKDDLYFYSDLWEKWIKLFETLHKNSRTNLHINLTCYAQPSPWFLQWVQSMWLQNSSDIGFAEKFDDGRKIASSSKDSALTYRDSRYYDFYRKRQFCFPPSRLYNHDPIYANEAKVRATDDEFREYLFTIAARGNLFRELYFSSNLMNEAKWRINNAATLFVKDNLRLLKRTVMFGGNPSLGQIYGYAGFCESEGVVTLRNPDCVEKEIEFQLDETLGVRNNFACSGMCRILPYSTDGAYGSFRFGDKIKETLAPFQTKILRFGLTQKKLECVYAKARSSRTLEVMFNQTVNIESVSCSSNPIKKAVLLADYRSALIEFDYDFNEGNEIVLENIKDILQNPSAVTLRFQYFEDYLVKNSGIEGDGDFSVKVTFSGEENIVLFMQKDDIKLYTEGGYIYFKVGDTVLRSRSSVLNVVQVCAVRERNGVLKLYLNGKLDSGINPIQTTPYIENSVPVFFDEKRTKLYNRALAYDEV